MRNRRKNGFSGKLFCFRSVECGIQQGNLPIHQTPGSVGLQVGGSPSCN